MDEGRTGSRRVPDAHWRRLQFIAATCALAFVLLPCLAGTLLLILRPGGEAPLLVQAVGIAMTLICLWLIKGCLRAMWAAGR
jgi:hypothetical protein